MAQTIGGIAGAAIGFAVGGPAGAQWGWAIGAAVGSSFTTIKQPRIGDLAEIKAGEGGPRARVYGTFRPIGGQVVWSGRPREIRTRKRQGKGGPKVESSTILRSYAIGICEGPITSVSRIWRNNELVYDVRPGSTILAESTRWLQGKTILLGGWDQLPHPTIEAEAGAANAPAMRGTAMLVVTDEDLTDLRGAIPAYQFEVGGGSSGFGTTWDPASIVGSLGLLADQDRTFYVGGASDPPNDTSGFFNRVKAKDPKTSGKFYFEVYSDYGAGQDVPGLGTGFLNIRRTLRVGLTTSNTALSVVESTSGSAPNLSWEVAWKFVENFSTRLRGIYYRGGGQGSNNNFPLSTSTSSWVGVAVEIVGPAENCGIQAWSIIDGAWGESGATPITAPTGHSFLSISGIDATTQGGFVPYASIRYPRANHAGQELKINAGQEPFRIGAAAFAPGGVLAGFTAGWPASGSVSSATPGSLKSIVSAICRDASIDATKVDVETLPDLFVPGFSTSPDYSAAEALRELAKVYYFDVQDADGKVRFIPRGGNFAAILTEDEFVDGEDEPETDTTRDALSVPRLLHLQYFDVDGGQGPDKQFSERQISTRSEAPTVLQTPVVLDAETAARTIRVQHQVMEEELRGELVFGVSDRRIALAESDVVIVQYRGRSQRCRITKIELMDGWQRITAVRDRQSAYTVQVQPVPPAPVTRPPESIPGATRFAFLDIPALSQAGDVLSYHLAVSGEQAGWRGAAIERQEVGGEYGLLTTDGIGTVMGTLTQALPEASPWYPDESNAVFVQLARADDDLQAVTREVWLGRGNAAALVRADGTAEVLQFRDAVETTPGTWRLTGLQRGRLNSGASAHAIGTTFVLLDGAQLVQAPSERLATTITHRAYSVGELPATATPVARTWTGRSQREWPPIIESATRTGDTLEVTWTPRHRFGSDENPVPSSHFDGWQVDATSGGTTRTTTVLTPTASLDVTGLANPITVTVRGRNRLAGLGDPSTRTVP